MKQKIQGSFVKNDKIRQNSDIFYNFSTPINVVINTSLITSAIRVKNKAILRPTHQYIEKKYPIESVSVGYFFVSRKTFCKLVVKTRRLVINYKEENTRAFKKHNISFYTL